MSNDIDVLLSATANDIVGGSNFEEDITPVDDGDMPF